MSMKLKIANEIRTVTKVYDYGSGMAMVDLDDDTDWYLATDSESAGEAVSEYYRDMRNNDKREFICIMGEERLLQWACDESDSFGISSFEQFLERVAEVPEEHWGSYDGTERDCEIVPEWAGETAEDLTSDAEFNEQVAERDKWEDTDSDLYAELGFIPTVAYRHN